MAKVSTSLAAKASASTAVGQKLPKFSAAVKTILESELLKVDCWGRIASGSGRGRFFVRPL